jgi:ribosomal protein L37E
MKTKSAGLQFAITFCMAMAGCTVLPAAVLLGSDVSGLEPFRTWTDYFACGVKFTLVGAVLLSIPFAVFSATLLLLCDRPTRRAVIGSFRWVWVATPMVLVSFVGSMLQITYNPGFGGPINSGPPPVSWKPTLALMAHPAVWWVGSGVAVLLIVRGYAPQLAKWRRLEATDKCRHCGYNTTGLKSAVCPECGNDYTEERHGGRTIHEGIGPAVSRDQ